MENDEFLNVELTSCEGSSVFDFSISKYDLGANLGRQILLLGLHFVFTQLSAKMLLYNQTISEVCLFATFLSPVYRIGIVN